MTTEQLIAQMGPIVGIFGFSALLAIIGMLIFTVSCPDKERPRNLLEQILVLPLSIGITLVILDALMALTVLGKYFAYWVKGLL